MNGIGRKVACSIWSAALAVALVPAAALAQPQGAGSVQTAPAAEAPAADEPASEQGAESLALDTWLPLSSFAKGDGLSVSVDGAVYDLEADFGFVGKKRTTVSLRSPGLAQAGHKLWYQVKLEGIGKLGWAHAGQSAGIDDYADPIEAVRLHVSDAAETAPGSTGNHLVSLPEIKYRVKTIGAKSSGWKNAGKTVGSAKRGTGASKVSVKVRSGFSGGVSYSVANRWDQTQQGANGLWAGWSGKQQQDNVQYLSARLTGDLGKRFALWYRVHGSDGTWHGWTRDGKSAGTTGLFAKTGALQMRILPKGAPAPGKTGGATARDKTRSYKIDGSYKAGTRRHRNLTRRPKGAKGIKYLCVHFTDDGTSRKGAAFANCQFFRRADRGRSADFFIDDGTVARYNPDCAKWYSWAVGDGHGKHGIWNRNSISIEVCLSGNRRFTKAEKLRLRYLVRWLMREYHVDERHVTRHYDASHKWCPQWYTPGGSGGSEGWKALKRYLMS